MMDENLKEEALAYMLHCIPGWGSKTLLKLYENFGSCADIVIAKEKELRNFITEKQFRSMQEVINSKDCEGEFRDLYLRGIDFYPIFSDRFPRKLKDIPDPPFAIYCIGKLPDEKRPAVSIIGARSGSEYGRYIAKKFGAGFAEAGVQVVSGMARGIDGIAQAGAINAGGDSYAVLGSGVDVCYPQENHALYDALIQSGGIISEYLPGTLPKPQYFPPRNRIISGLCDAVLVVEARIKSGTLITVDMALEQGKEVFAVPGRINDSLSEGCNCLIRQGASVATGIEDVLEFLRRKLPNDLAREEERTIKNLEFSRDNADENLSGIQKSVLEQMDMYPVTPSALYEKICEKGQKIAISELRNVLVELCVIGKVGQNGIGFYIKG